MPHQIVKSQVLVESPEGKLHAMRLGVKHHSFRHRYQSLIHLISPRSSGHRTTQDKTNNSGSVKWVINLTP